MIHKLFSINICINVIDIGLNIRSIHYSFFISRFPGSTQRYCQVDFKSSSGVTAATSLNGQTLLGVPIVITVIDPSTNIAQGMLPGIMPGMFGTAGGMT